MSFPALPAHSQYRCLPETTLTLTPTLMSSLNPNLNSDTVRLASYGGTEMVGTMDDSLPCCPALRAGAAYLHQLSSADLSRVVVVGELDTQHGPIHCDRGLEGREGPLL